MVTILRAYGLRIVIYVDDHEPAHVHVFGDGEAKINLIGRDGHPELVWAYRMSRGEVRKAMKLVFEQQAVFLTKWIEIHG